MKYNIGDIIVWLFPRDKREISTITKTWKDQAGLLNCYRTETYRKEEDRMLIEEFTELEIDGILDDKYDSAMAVHFPVSK